jgi:hypothetical protein
MKIRFLLILFLFALDFGTAAATPQDHEIIIYKGKKETLMSVPLESLVDKAESLGINLPYFSKYFSDDSSISMSTGNWRGYIATWEIDGETLYLVEISEPRGKKKADLSQIFGNYCAGNKVKAFWYTGDLRIPKGDLVSYIHMGFMSVYEREIVIEVENGIVKEISEYKNKIKDPPRGFQSAMTLNLSVDIPKSLSHCYDPISDTICLKDDKGELSIMGFVLHEVADRLDRNGQRDFVARSIDSCMQAMSLHITLSIPQFEKQRYGYVGWIDGSAKDNSGLMRTLVLANFYSRLYIQITLKELDKERL